MRYDYECGLGHRQEHTCLMSEMPETLPCKTCGGASSRIIISVPDAFMKFRPYEFDGSKTVANNGARFGRTREQQHEGYRKTLELQKSLVRKRSTNASKKGFGQYLGSMPGEMADSITEQEGDKNVVLRDPETWLKKTGLYVGEGE